MWHPCRDGVVLACEILDCCPWFEFADLDTYVSDEEGDGVSTTPDSAAGDTEDSGLDDDSRCSELQGLCRLSCVNSLQYNMLVHCNHSSCCGFVTAGSRKAADSARQTAPKYVVT